MAPGEAVDRPVDLRLPRRRLPGGGVEAHEAGPAAEGEERAADMDGGAVGRRGEGVDAAGAGLVLHAGLAVVAPAGVVGRQPGGEAAGGGVEGGEVGPRLDGAVGRRQSAEVPAHVEDAPVGGEAESPDDAVHLGRGEAGVERPGGGVEGGQAGGRPPTDVLEHAAGVDAPPVRGGEQRPHLAVGGRVPVGQGRAAVAQGGKVRPGDQGGLVLRARGRCGGEVTAEIHAPAAGHHREDPAGLVVGRDLGAPRVVGRGRHADGSPDRYRGGPQRRDGDERHQDVLPMSHPPCPLGSHYQHSGAVKPTASTDAFRLGQRRGFRRAGPAPGR